ncbi:kinesin motor protein cin8 [Dissophora globulifera]|nr:kinesin motor protein cin8 [Dissophora globulifera]
MFGARNGAGVSRPSSALANHKQASQQSIGNTAKQADSGNAGMIRKRTSSESVSSIGSTGNTHHASPGRSGAITHQPTVPRLNALTSHQSNQSGASIPNKELNIQVVVRIRSRSEREVRENSPIAVQANNREILVPSTLGDRAPSKSYNFDRVFMYSDQECIYHEVVTPILDEVLTGYNCTIFAYGQTGTGKTYTMEGDLRDNFGECSREAGIIPRTLYTLFAALERKNTEYTVRVSFLELYNEEVKDLLAADDDRKVVKIFDSIKKQGPLVQGLEEFSVFNATQGIEALRKGSAKRTVAATKSNDKSSRSHAVFAITVHVKETTDDGEELLKIGKLNLVDLAGSENIARSGAEATQAKEAGRINQSLLTLGRVINSLVERSQHIPYRESKLTRLLEDSLGGKTKTCIIATISPARSCLEETISTLNYANRAKNIKNTPEINQKMSKKTLIKEYLMEIDRLKADLNATREKNGVFMTQESYQSLLDESTSNKDLVGETQKQVEKINLELTRVEEKFRENMRLLTTTEYKLGLSTAELETKRVELQETQDQLVKTKQSLQEETLLRQAHAHTEEQLNAVAADLRASLTATVKDVEGLHEKLERKNLMERENRRTLVEFQERLATLSSKLGSRIQGFGSNQADLLASVTQKLDKTFQSAVEGAEDTQAHLTTHLERMSKAVETFSALENNTSERATAFKMEFEALRLEMTEFLKSRVEMSQANATEGFEELKRMLLEFTESVERQQQGMTEQVLGLVDKSTAFSQESIDRHQQALNSYEKATREEIDFLTLQNQALRQQLWEQEVRKDEQKSALLSEIGGLLDKFLKEQTGALMGHFSNTSSALEGSMARLSKAHLDQGTWTSEIRRLGVQHMQELVGSRSEFQQESTDARSRTTQQGLAMAAKTDTLRSRIEEELHSQQAFMQTKMFDMNGKAMSGYEQLQSQHSALAKMFSQASNHTITALQDLRIRTTTTRSSMEAAHHQTSDELTAAKDQMLLFRDDASHDLELSRKEVDSLLQSRIKVDDSTGRTPSRKKYTYPETWGRTRPSRDLLQEFRELGRVNTFTIDRFAEANISVPDDSAVAASSLGLESDSSASPFVNMASVYQRARTASGSSAHSTAADSTNTVIADGQTRSTSASNSRRTSQSFLRQEIDDEKENSVEPPQPFGEGGDGISRPSRTGKFGLHGALDIGFGRKEGDAGVSVSLPLKRSVTDMEEEKSTNTPNSGTGSVGLTDISNSIHSLSSLPVHTSIKSNGNIAALPSVPAVAAAAAPSIAAPSGLAAFGTGKSGLVNGAEGPRKVIRPTAAKPVRRPFPFGGNNKS